MIWVKVIVPGRSFDWLLDKEDNLAFWQSLYGEDCVLFLPALSNL